MTRVVRVFFFFEFYQASLIIVCDAIFTVPSVGTHKLQRHVLWSWRVLLVQYRVGMVVYNEVTRYSASVLQSIYFFCTVYVLTSVDNVCTV